MSNFLRPTILPVIDDFSVLLIGVQDTDEALGLEPVSGARQRVVAWYVQALCMGVKAGRLRVLCSPTPTLGDVGAYLAAEGIDGCLEGCASVVEEVRTRLNGGGRGLPGALATWTNRVFRAFASPTVSMDALVSGVPYVARAVELLQPSTDRDCYRLARQRAEGPPGTCSCSCRWSAL